MSILWSTPKDLFDKLDKEFNFRLDVCALPDNAKCAKYYTPDDDGLAQSWTISEGYDASVWMNPPYGEEIAHWMRKAYENKLLRSQSGSAHPEPQQCPMVA